MRIFGRRIRWLAASIAAGIVFSAPLGAFTLEPISTLLAPSGAGSVGTFRIKNDGAQRIAVKASVLARGLSPQGEETNEPADGLFAVYPARLLIEPGSSASLKVQWKGEAKLDSERCFRLLAEQVPLLSGDAKTSSIRVMFRYLASIYVGDAGFKADLAATASGAQGEDGKTGIIVEVANRGTRHVVALDLSVDLVDDQGTAFTLSGEELGTLNGANYLPLLPRRLFIPREDARPGASYEARLKFEDEY